MFDKLSFSVSVIKSILADISFSTKCLCMQGILMMTSGFFRLLPDLPKPFWRYPVSYLSYGSWGIQVTLC